MKRIYLFIMPAILLLTMLFALPTSASAKYVSGYLKKNGTYVQPYNRTSPNNIKIDNYSSKGNVNPYTGKKGYVNPTPTYKAPKITTPKYTQPKIKAPTYKAPKVSTPVYKTPKYTAPKIKSYKIK